MGPLDDALEQNGRYSFLPIQRLGLPTIWCMDDSDVLRFTTRVLGRSTGAVPAPPLAMPMEEAARAAAERHMRRLAIKDAMDRWLQASEVQVLVRAFLG